VVKKHIHDHLYLNRNDKVPSSPHAHIHTHTSLCALLKCVQYDKWQKNICPKYCIPTVSGYRYNTIYAHCMCMNISEISVFSRICGPCDRREIPFSIRALSGDYSFLFSFFFHFFRVKFTGQFFYLLRYNFHPLCYQ